LHTVTLSQPFYLGKSEVTQAQWQAVMGTTPSRFSKCRRRCPVEFVSWADAQAFITALNRREGIRAYRLPTEAEWEYAARAGMQTAYHFGNAARELKLHAWYDKAGFLRGAGPRPVGQGRPNAWGLYDMHGNV
jgi:formylglycine-generating enzyme required for sulfatase activity